MSQYRWMVRFFDRTTRLDKISTHPGHNILDAISSTLQYNPKVNIKDIIEIDREGEIPDE